MEALIGLVKDFFNTEWELVEFSDTSTALQLGLLFLILIGAKLMIGRRRTKGRAQSGHFIYKPSQQGFVLEVFFLTSRTIIALGVFFILFALADPFTSKSSERETVDSRERVEVLDVSASMGFRYSGRSKESLAAIVRRQHLKFIEARRGLNDRVALWLFADAPYRMESFIQDDEVYMMQVAHAPFVMVDKSHYVKKDPAFIVPEEKIHSIKYSGATDMVRALRGVLDYLDRESDIRIDRKAILMITDAAANDYPEEELREIKRRGIALYVLFIKPAPRMFELASAGNEAIKRELENSKMFIDQMKLYGGKYYEANNEESIARIFTEINDLESIRTQKMRHALKVHIYFQPLAIGVILLAIGSCLALLFELAWPERP